MLRRCWKPVMTMPPRMLTDEQLELLRANITDMSYRDQQAFIKEHFGLELTLAQCKQMRTNHKMFSKRTGRFQKGRRSEKKGKHIWKDGIPENVQKTFFKKGSIPQNARPAGWERADKSGYVFIKVPGKRTMVPKHRWVWEQAKGPIPKDCMIVFLNGDKSDCRLENLASIPRSLGPTLNKYGLLKKDPDLSRAGIRLAELIQKKARLKKALKGGDENEPRKKAR